MLLAGDVTTVRFFFAKLRSKSDIAMFRQLAGLAAVRRTLTR